MKRKNQRTYFLFLGFLYFFLLYDWMEQQISFIGYADELIAACAIFLLLSRKVRHALFENEYQKRYSICVAVFLFLGFLSSIIFQTQPFFRAALPDMFLCAKFWLALYVGQYFLRGFSIQEHANGIIRHIRLITVCYTILTVGNYVLIICGKGGLFPALERYGMYATQLFYSHPSRFASCCALLMVILLGIHEYAAGTSILFIWLVLLLCTSLRIKALGGAFIFSVLYYFIGTRRDEIPRKAMMFSVVVLILLGGERIYYYFFSNIQADSARYQLTVKSMQIAGDYFPLGSGFASFASHFSGVYYSPLYEGYGISQVWGLRPDDHKFISDTFWPMILGQTGIFGMILFAFALFFLFKRIQELQKESFSLYASALGCFSYLLLCSASDSAYVNPVAIPFALWMGTLFSFADGGGSGS